MTAKDVRRILLCLIGGVIMAVNLKTFIRTGGLLPGGFSGVALLIQNVALRFGGVEIPYAPLYLILNLAPAIISFRKIGTKFTLYSCIVILTVSFLTDLIPSYVVTYDTLLISIFGGIINGLAVTLCLLAGASGGGTDFIAIYASDKYNIDAFNYILLFNAFILILDGFLFGWDYALYSIIFQFTVTQIIHYYNGMYKRYTLFVVTDHPVNITHVINRETLHGATAIDVTGTYQEKQRTMIYSVIGGDEMQATIRGIREIDSDAFVNVIRTDSLRGRFVTRPRD